MLIKFKGQDFEEIKETHPDLYTVINTNFAHLDSHEKGRIAGMMIEYLIQAGGDVDIFQDDMDIVDEFEEEDKW